MKPNLSPYRFDVGRYLQLLRRPNAFYARPRGPVDSVFPASGLLRLPGAVSATLCDQAVSEYAEFESLRRARGCLVADESGRNYRVTNLHLKSSALRAIGLTAVMHESAGRFFGARSSIYTSLYFKHGSQQEPHIDTPFFWTRPFNLFVGVWVALEDVHEAAGPLVYYSGSHMHYNSEAELRSVFESAGSDVQGMFKLMRAEIERHCRPEVVLLRKGDVVIWHPGLMHGGTPATEAGRTRHSAVFHFAPLGVNVRDHRVFPQDFFNLPTYGVVQEGNGSYCRASLPAAMI